MKLLRTALIWLMLWVVMGNFGFNCMASAMGRAKSKGHTCKWVHCPYKGIYPHWYAKVVKKYTGQGRSSAAFWVDFFHLKHPLEEYDQLEDRLLTIKRIRK